MQRFGRPYRPGQARRTPRLLEVPQSSAFQELSANRQFRQAEISMPAGTAWGGMAIGAPGRGAARPSGAELCEREMGKFYRNWSSDFLDSIARSGIGIRQQPGE